MWYVTRQVTQRYYSPGILPDRPTDKDTSRGDNMILYKKNSCCVSLERKGSRDEQLDCKSPRNTCSLTYLQYHSHFKRVNKITLISSTQGQTYSSLE